MAIATSCDECGRDYSLKDELAGKKFKCKDCGAIVVIPTPRKSVQASSGTRKGLPKKKRDPDDEFQDALSSDGLEDGADEDEQPRRAVKRKPVAKKKKSSKSSSGGSALWAKIGGGVFTTLLVLSFVMRLIRAAGGVGGGVSWQEFQSPHGRYSVTFPSAAKLKPQPQNLPGASTYVAETRNFACAVTHVPLPAGAGTVMGQLSPQALSDQIIQGAFPGVRPLASRLTTLAGKPCQETSLNNAGTRLTERSIVVGDELFNCEFVSKGDPSQADLAKFFDSFRITGAAGGANAAPVAAVNPAPTTSGTFQQRRQSFQTKLVKAGPSPQPFQNETPPAGVQVVTFPSGNLQLKAWVSVPSGGAGAKAPALVFFHGGFAFGADDLEACRAAMDAGMAVMTPILRGENGSPGNYELFFGEIDDARAAVKWLAAQTYVDPQRIYTFGHSVGGGVSAVLSLMDDVPIQHGGSSGGLYPEAVFAAWQADGTVPFDMRNPEERRLRMLIGNMRDMRHKHFAYLGASDSLALFANDAKKEAPGTQCEIFMVPGDHMTSFEPALRQYLQIIQRGP